MQFIQLYNSTEEEDLETYFHKVMEGLSQPIKCLPPEYNYDEFGSQMFSQINKHPDYYLARCEISILQEQSSDILACMGKDKFNLVELGAGDGLKVKFLIETAVKEGYEFEYIPSTSVTVPT